MANNESNNNKKFNNNEKRYSDSIKFARRCISFEEFQKMQEESAEPDLDNNGNNVEYKNKLKK